MRTVKIKLYSFEELSPIAKKKAIEAHRYINAEEFGEGFNWYELVFDDWTEKLEKMGFENPQISFSGFYSQGDGASFVCDGIDPIKYWEANGCGPRPLVRKLISSRTLPVWAQIVRHSSHDSHENTVRGEWEGESDLYRCPLIAAELERHMGALFDEAKNMMREIYRDLEKCYGSITSDESIASTLIEGEYEFLASGELSTF